VSALQFSYLYQSSTRKKLQIIAIVLNFLGGAEILYLAGMTYYTQRKQLINGRYHCPHCLSKSIQIKAVLIFSCVQFALFIATSNTEIPSANNCPLWYLVSTRILQIFLSFTLSLLPNRVYKFSAHLKKEALESRLNLIGYLSHEMRSPLHIAFLGLEYINGEMSKIGERLAVSNEKTETDQAYRDNNEVVSTEQIEDILTTSHHVLDSCRVATTTLDDLLTADKIGDGKLLINPLFCNPWGLFKSCIGPFSINANDKSISFAVMSVDRTLSRLMLANESALSMYEYSVEVDEFKISQVIRNMLSNALKFTPPEGEVSMDIEIVLAPEKSAVRSISKKRFDRIVRLSVKDTGPGIAPEDQKKLFGKYVQFNAGALQKGKGSGLGLWISRNIMELHGGTLTGMSEGLGKGSTFTLELPLYGKLGTLHGSFSHIELGSLEGSFSDLNMKSSISRVDDITPVMTLHRAMSYTLNSFRRSSMILPEEKLSLVNFPDSETVATLESLEICPLVLKSRRPTSKSIGRLELESISLKTKLSLTNPLLLDGVEQLTASWEKGLRILLVDDSLPNRKVLKKLLISRGHAVAEAVDGVDFLKCLGYSLDDDALLKNLDNPVVSITNNNNQPRSTAAAALHLRGSVVISNFFDLVLIDDNMPRLNGSNAVGLLRGVGYSGLILGITGDADPASIQAFRAKGADDVMSKPIDLEQLKKRVTALLDRNI